MGFKSLDEAIAASVKAAGFRVFRSINPSWRSFLYFSDGRNIGYLQKGAFGGVDLTTVHRPNRQTGTGFALGPAAKLTRAELERAFIFAPSWATGPDMASVQKYADLSAWLASSRLGVDIVEI